MIRTVFTAIALLSSPATAQLSIAPDPSQLATKAEVQAITTAMPAPCAVVLPADTTQGSTGTAAPCSPRADASRPANVQAANVTTDASGNFSVSFARTMNSATPIVLAFPINGNSNPGVCNVAARSAAGASGKCWLSSGVTVSVLGSVVNVFSAAANLPVMVTAREPTQ